MCPGPKLTPSPASEFHLPDNPTFRICQNPTSPSRTHRPHPLPPSGSSGLNLLPLSVSPTLGTPRTRSRFNSFLPTPPFWASAANNFSGISLSLSGWTEDHTAGSETQQKAPHTPHLPPNCHCSRGFLGEQPELHFLRPHAGYVLNELTVTRY